MKSVVILRSSSSPARVINEAYSLRDSGYSVSVLYWERNSNTSKTEEINDVQINYFGLKAPYGSLFLIPYLLIWWTYEIIFLLKNDFDIIHSCCFDTLLPAVLTKALKKNKIVYDILDFYGECLPKNTSPVIITLVSKIEKFFIRFADSVIIVDEARYVQIKNSKFKNLDIIMNCPTDVSFKQEKPKNQYFTIFYGGMISKTRGLIELIESIQNEMDIKLIIAGVGEDDNFFKNLLNGMENADFIGWVSYDQYIDLTYKADIIFGFYDPSIPNNRLASPNKLFEAMMCGTPIIVNEETSMAEIVKKEYCGVAVPYNNTETLKKSILYLKENPDLRIRMGENGRKAYEKIYNWNIMKRRLINTYKKLNSC